jgi:hypothetical protein
MASSGNFCTLNPLTEYNSRMNQGTISHGNTKYDDVGGDGWICNIAMTHKTYCEYRIDSLGGYGGVQGLRGIQANAQTYDSVTFQASYSSGQIYHYKGTSDQSYSGNIGGTVSAGSIVMMAYDPATYKWWVGVNGTWRNSGDPANGTGYVFEGSATMFENMNVTWGGWSGDVNRLDHTWNFGQDSTFAGQETAGGNADENGFGDFKYTPPTGFLALCTGNMVISDDIDPAQTDSDYPGKQFNTVLYTGNGSDGHGITGVDFQPDFVWLKKRSASASHQLYDSSRGTGKLLSSNNSDAEATYSTVLQSFDSDGFTLGTSAAINGSSATMVAWCWRANGGTTASNSDGSITSTVQANTAAGFSIITYTGTGSNATIGHGLSAKPDFIIFKRRSGSAQNWRTYHTGTGTKVLTLNDDRAEETIANEFQNTEPTSSIITLGTSSNVNTSSGTHVAYCWHGVDGYSKFGKYTGNGNDDNAFVYTGFRPRLIFIKRIDSTAHWYAYDTARSTFNPVDDYIEWSDTDAEETNYQYQKYDFLSNGFKVRGSNNIGGANGGTYIYGAWGDVPFKYNNTF